MRFQGHPISSFKKKKKEFLVVNFLSVCAQSVGSSCILSLPLLTFIISSSFNNAFTCVFGRVAGRCCKKEMRNRFTASRAVAVAAPCIAAERCFSSFSDGSDGKEWKQRYLQERRETALEFLGDVKKRVPIHEAIRQRASINKKATSDIHCPTFFDTSFNRDDNTDTDDTHEGVVDELLDDLLQDENAVDKLRHVNFSDLPLLDNELLGGGESDEEMLRNWLRLKRDTADYQSYASIPESERTAWSAWYLRHVKGKEGS